MSGGTLMSKEIEGELVVVKNFPMRELAETAKQILKESGIESLLQSSEIVGSGTMQGVDLYVRKGERDAALQLLESLYNGI
jgi:hypothetical protein